MKEYKLNIYWFVNGQRHEIENKYEVRGYKVPDTIDLTKLISKEDIALIKGHVDIFEGTGKVSHYSDDTIHVLCS